MHLIIIGGGTAAISAARDAVSRGMEVTVVHEGLPLGGCCLNVGCVPSKYLIRAAEQVHQSHWQRFPGIEPKGADLDTRTLLKDQRGLVAALRKRNYEDPLPDLAGLRMVKGWGTLRDGRTVEVNGETITGDAILIATGSRTATPPIPGLETVDLLTNENLFALEELPDSVLVLGGGYIALEMAQMMQRMGTRVTLLQRSGHVLSKQPAELGETLADFFRDEGMAVYCDTQIKEIRRDGDEVRATFEHEGEEKNCRAQAVFAALGRAGNTEGLHLEEMGVETHGNGFVRVNEAYETSLPGVYAAGDVLGGHLLVYTASFEAEQIVARLAGDAARTLTEAEIPWVVFTDPQVAGVGLDAASAREQGYEVEEAVLPVNRWPRFSTAHETRGFLKLYRDPKTDLLLGARVICPEGGDLTTELAWIRNKKIPLREVATSLAPYLTLSEGISKCAAKFYP
ncbi:MAG: NAD(P)/FAD-dependent oxidoreductase [Verrucomicrobia bacterium]|nr:NAD(P)/FAD-dependent oxidoreductase [Verrucomicrobiota bacterium]MCH8512864.1 NAD(P)/FAD-dependent oxidoreductase [Kiritimatiellia bacterium]